MVKVDNRLKRKIREDPHVVDNVIDTLVELQKLIDYYKTELRINVSEVKRCKREKEFEEIPMYMGRIEAYRDSIFEMEHVVELLRGNHRDMEEQ